ncbi:sensor histidine kinase [Streptomyces scopuliridis]|uniref:sensor histidine kinase n=1 Tax=Streptomyces scopuliridis TaxID=452529 RepID=UPI0035E13125
MLGDSENHLILRLLSWLVSMSQADHAHPRVRQWGLPALLALFGLPSLIRACQGAEPGVSAVAVLLAGLTIPLLWRERRPLLVFLVVAVASAFDIGMEVMAGSNASRIVALYNVARFGTPAQLAFALAVSIPEAIITGLILASRGSLPYATQVPGMVIVLLIGTVAAAGLGLASRMARAYIATLEERAVRLETERDQRARLAVAAERGRVAREMHDILGHTLSVIIGLADGAAGLAENSPKRGADTLRIIADSGRGALGELRRLLAIIRDDEKAPDSPPLAPQPTLADLDALLDGVRAAGPTVSLRTEGDLTGLTPGLQLTVYRIVQEALTNSLKHAGPDTFTSITVSADPYTVCITAQDSGPTSTPHKIRAENDPGHGLLGMRERAALYQGEVSVGPNSLGGWTVHVRLLLAASTRTEKRTP